MPSAEILPFPHPADSRLRAALKALDAALAEQRDAVAEFRAHIGALGDAVTGLEESLRRYSCNLAAAQSDVYATHEAALKLEATAEAWIQRFGPGGSAGGAAGG